MTRSLLRAGGALAVVLVPAARLAAQTPAAQTPAAQTPAAPSATPAAAPMVR